MKLRIAIPTWNDRVSPVFDTATQALLVDFEADSEIGRSTAPIAEVMPQRRITRLSELGANVLICGAISRPLAAMAEGAGIRIVPWVAGGIEEILQAYLTGQLPAPQFMMPGCLGRCRGFGRGGWGRGGRGGRWGRVW